MANEKPIELHHYPDLLKEHAPFGPYRAAVTRVVDGDTFHCLIDVGFHVYTYQSIRLARVNAPEIRGADRDRGHAAKLYVEDLVAAYGRHVVLTSMKWPQSFGRYVADVAFPGSDGTSWDLARRMVDAGHAVWSES